MLDNIEFLITVSLWQDVANKNSCLQKERTNMFYAVAPFHLYSKKNLIFFCFNIILIQKRSEIQK